MYIIKKADGSEAIVMGDKPGFKRLKTSEVISTANIEQVKARRKAEAEAAAKAEAEKSTPTGPNKKETHDEKA